MAFSRMYRPVLSAFTTTILCTLFGMIILGASHMLLANATNPSGFSGQGGVDVYVGGKESATTYPTIARFLINALSTVLLALASFYIRYSTAPTREDVDAAHRKGRYLNIGVLSIGNFNRRSLVRRFILALVAFSTFFIHTLWNACVFETREVYSINTALGPEELTHNKGGKLLHSKLSEGFSLRISIRRLGMALCATVVEVVVIYCTFPKNERHERFIALGDAMKSFLEKPDLTTRNMGTIGERDIRQGLWEQHQRPRFLSADGRYFGSAVPSKIWAAALMWWAVTLIFLARLFSWSSELPELSISINSCGILRANVLHVAITISLLFYHIVFSYMLANLEYASFAVRPSALRFSRPSGSRSRLLNLPSRYSVFLLVNYSVLHWLVSEAIRPVHLEVIAPPDTLIKKGNYSGGHMPSTLLSHDSGGIILETRLVLQYSPYYCVLSICAFGYLLTAMACMAFRKYPGLIPLGATNSAVISAACHPRTNDLVSHGAFFWGEDTVDFRTGQRHVSFTREYRVPAKKDVEYM